MKEDKKNHAIGEMKKRERTKIYHFGFWLFFFLTLFSVIYSVWAITSIYTSYKVVTKILDESFERTNLVLDITGGEMTACQEKLKSCESSLSQG